MAQLNVKDILAQKLDIIAKDRGYENWRHFTRTWMKSEIITDEVSRMSIESQKLLDAELGEVDGK